MKKRPPPAVEVVRRPPLRPQVAPAAARAQPPRPSPPPTPPAAARPARDAHTGALPQARPPDEAAVLQHAQAERVPARIARSALAGGMSCADWRRKYPDEAARYDTAHALSREVAGLSLAHALSYVSAGASADVIHERFATARALCEGVPGLPLPVALAQLASGLSPEAIRLRFDEERAREEVTRIRAAVPATPVEDFLSGLQRERTPLVLTLLDRSVLDTLLMVERLDFTLTNVGPLPKLHVQTLAGAHAWGELMRTPEGGAWGFRRAKPPAAEPFRRAVCDARAFLPHVGRRVRISLSTGLELQLRLQALGPFDVLLDAPGGTVLVPLHAMTAWHAA